MKSNTFLTFAAIVTSMVYGVQTNSIDLVLISFMIGNLTLHVLDLKTMIKNSNCWY